MIGAFINNRYLVKAEIGRGDIGVAYRAVDTPVEILSRHLRAPVIPPGAHDDPIPPALDLLITTFLREHNSRF